LLIEVRENAVQFALGNISIFDECLNLLQLDDDTCLVVSMYVNSFCSP
jgi:hypothetical protein